MKIPKKAARNLPLLFPAFSASSPEFFFRKKLTVIGIIGKTHGVRSITSPHPIALRMIAHNDFLPPASPVEALLSSCDIVAFEPLSVLSTDELPSESVFPSTATAPSAA